MEGGEGNAKRGCGRWMEESGRGAAVEQLTARGMKYQSPRWGAIVRVSGRYANVRISIPAMGGNRTSLKSKRTKDAINPRDGGQ